jgi:hypothetical protein
MRLNVSSCKKLKTLTKENDKWRERGRIIRNLLLTVLTAASITAYPTYKWHEGMNYARQLENHVLQLQHDSSMRGCPVFYPSTSIVIAGTDPVAMRMELHRIANDVDLFNTQLSKILKRDNIGVEKVPGR